MAMDEGGLVPKTLTVTTEDGVLHVQVIELGKQARAHVCVRKQLTATQTFIWLADGSATLDSLVAAIPTRFDRLPAVSSLLGSGSGASLAQRLCAYAPEPGMRNNSRPGSQR